VLSQLSITGQLEQFTQKLNSVDLQGISNNLNQSLTSLNQTLENVAALTDSLNKKKTVDKLNKTIESYSANSDLYKSLMDMSQKLNTTLDELSPTIKKVGQKSNSLVFSSDSKDVEIKVKK
jgi:paraquat-inducible protein B